MNKLSKWNPLSKSTELDVWHPSARWAPFQEVEDMMRSMQRAFGGFPVAAQESMTLADWTPSVDIGEDDKEFIVKAELPEVKKEDIKVNVEDGTLSISGERKVEKEEKGLKFHRIERAYGRFERLFTLPDGADASKITSEFKEGILTIHLPKSPNLKPTSHMIPVQ